MSKYQSLWNYFKYQNDEIIKLSFDDIKKILGFEIDHSFLTFKKELLEFGYEVNKISMKCKLVEFKKLK